MAQQAPSGTRSYPGRSVARVGRSVAITLPPEVVESRGLDPDDGDEVGVWWDGIADEVIVALDDPPEECRRPVIWRGNSVGVTVPKTPFVERDIGPCDLITEHFVPETGRIRIPLP